MKYRLGLVILALCIQTRAFTVENSIPTEGWFRIRATQIPSAEPIAALRLRVYLKASAQIASTTLKPGSAGIWSQIPPDLKRDGQTLEVTALAPNHTGLSSPSPLAIFELDLVLAMAMDVSAIDSVRVIEALDAKARRLDLAAQLTTSHSGARDSGPALQPVTLRQVDRMHEIDFFLAKPVAVRGRVLDARGRAVRVLAEGVMPQGRHRIRWDGRDAASALVPSGRYFLELRLGPNTYTKQVSHAL